MFVEMKVSSLRGGKVPGGLRGAAATGEPRQREGSHLQKELIKRSKSNRASTAEQEGERKVERVFPRIPRGLVSWPLGIRSLGGAPCFWSDFFMAIK